MVMDPEKYDAWYQTKKGAWFGAQEFKLIKQSLQPMVGASLLDVGCGTGHFTRRFADIGLNVTGLDPDTSMLAFAEKHSSNVAYQSGNAEQMPFPDNSFEYVVAITSLCFIDDPVQAIKEMWRVTNNKLILGLLNKNSLLCKQKQNKGSYLGARWDTRRDVENWLKILNIKPTSTTYSSAINIPGSNVAARVIEHMIPGHFLYGGFLTACLSKQLVSVSGRIAN